MTLGIHDYGQVTGGGILCLCMSLGDEWLFVGNDLGEMEQFVIEGEDARKPAKRFVSWGRVVGGGVKEILVGDCGEVMLVRGGEGCVRVLGVRDRGCRKEFEGVGQICSRFEWSG